jgi:hypothetical protein
MMIILWLTEMRKELDKWFSEGVTCVCAVESLNKSYLIQAVDKHQHSSDKVLPFSGMWHLVVSQNQAKVLNRRSIKPHGVTLH